MKILSAIQRPTLVVNKDRVLKNIERMAAKARRNQVRFRPHFKTHQSPLIGRWFRDFGLDCITVSSVEMAHTFSRDGWSDITIAFPVNLRELDEINQLAGKIRLNLLVESVEVVRNLNEYLDYPVGVWIKIDLGYHRTGIDWSDSPQILKIARLLTKSPGLEFKGLLAHFGDTYQAASPKEIRAIYSRSMERLQTVKSVLESKGFSEIELSIGDTPSCSLVDDFQGVDEIRPGNFVFYDAMQWRLGVCQVEDIAAVVACPVVARHPSRNEIVIYGGAIHLSKEFLLEAQRKVFGYPVRPIPLGWGAIWPDSYLSRLSQEHGIVQMRTDSFQKFQVGDLLPVIPVHSCLAAHLLKDHMVIIDFDK
ncbi:MAG: D-TA family PLP-dependent enzyme [Calditrichia bacterium]